MTATMNPVIADGQLPRHRRAIGGSALDPLNPPWNVGRVGQVLLRGNDVPAKLGHLPNGNVTAPETPKIFLGNPAKVDAVHAARND
jgi:hypothetical protein